MALLLDIVSGICFLISAGFMLTGAIGILRMPDFYTRLHAAGLTDTMGSTFLVAGLLLQSGWSLTPVRLVLMLLFIYFTGPVATHALAHAAYFAGLRPRLATDTDKSEGAAPSNIL